MSPRRVTTVSGCTRWACAKCGLSSINRWTAMICCTDMEEEMNDLPCDTEPADHVLEEAVTLETNPARTAYPWAQPAKQVPEPKAAELLGRAARLMHERGQTYDEPDGERSMAKTVAAFNAVTGHSMRESEGWLFMNLLKAVRSETRSEPHQDSLEDMIAYAALYAEARGEGR